MYDLNNLRLLERLAHHTPAAFAGYQALDAAAFAPGAIPPKYKELIAVAVATATQCAYCLHVHGRQAAEARATEQELAEAVAIAIALRAGGALTHATHALAASRAGDAVCR